MFDVYKKSCRPKKNEHYPFMEAEHTIHHEQVKGENTKPIETHCLPSQKEFHTRILYNNDNLHTHIMFVERETHISHSISFVLRKIRTTHEYKKGECFLQHAKHGEKMNRWVRIMLLSGGGDKLVGYYASFFTFDPGDAFRIHRRLLVSGRSVSFLFVVVRSPDEDRGRGFCHRWSVYTHPFSSHSTIAYII